MTILDDIVTYKRNEVAAAKSNTPQSALEALARDYRPRGFQAALEQKAQTGFALIAEIKKASPSKGLIRKDFAPAAHAHAYEEGGAACLSVLTDGPSFQGAPDFLRAARDAVPLPILRKDFMVDPYQVLEARAWGADCILIIMACTTDALAAELKSAADDAGLDALVEVHNVEELERAVQLNAKMIGVNNRNLNTFVTDLATTAEVASNAPADAFIVAESGIRDNSDLVTLSGHGAKAFLVGESLMREDDVASATRALIQPAPLA